MRGIGLTGSPLHALTLVADTSDLTALDTIVGDASIVALGDATHGTHEFFTLRLRLVDYLVRTKGFDVLSIEAPFPIMERVNAYVQGEPGDPRALLAEMRTRLLYLFWDVEELLAVIEWAREYNAHRGGRSPLVLAGADIYDYDGAAAGVLSYLRSVDPPAAAQAEAGYACVGEGDRSYDCRVQALAIRDLLLERAPRDGRLEDAIHHADVVLQAFHLQTYEPRDESMAANLLWIRDHRGSGRVIHWGHQEHAGKLPSPYVRGPSMGTHLAAELGPDYVAIGTLAGSGSFLQWERLASGIFTESVVSLPDPAQGTFESHFRAQGHTAMIVPLRGRNVTAGFRTGGTTSGWQTLTQSLPAKLDALIYVDRTTPSTPLRR